VDEARDRECGSDDEADREFRSHNPKISETRIVKFRSGRYRNVWSGNVVAIGNSAGFVEPLEATAIGAICMQSRLLAESLLENEVTREALRKKW